MWSPLIAVARVTHGVPCCRAGCAVTDKGLAVVGQHLRELVTLEMAMDEMDDFDDVTDTGIEHVARLPNLTSLDIDRRNEISDEGVKHLARLPQLTTLYLTCSDRESNAEERVRHLTELGCTPPPLILSPSLLESFSPAL